MTSTDSPRARRTTWAAGLVVATGAGVATAHGLYQVAAAARVAAPIAWLYPLITDGLALVAYAATARLHYGGRRYAAGIVILAAGLSGLAQAVYLAGGLDHTTAAPVGLRFGVGAWPAIAAALTAHLLHLIGTDTTAERAASPSGVERRPTFNPAFNGALSSPVSNPLVQPRPTEARPTEARPTGPVQPAGGDLLDTPIPGLHTDTHQGGSARDRARGAARRHRARHGALPTVTELAQLAGTSRGTAATALKDLRKERLTLHVVNTNPENGTHE
jgi:hypothetical protein